MKKILGKLFEGTCMCTLLALFLISLVSSCNDNGSCAKPSLPSPQSSFKLLEEHGVQTNDTLIVEHIDLDYVYLRKLHR